MGNKKTPNLSGYSLMIAIAVVEVKSDLSIIV